MIGKTINSPCKLQPTRPNFHDILNQQCEQVFATLKNVESTSFEKEWKKLRLRHHSTSNDDSHDNNESRVLDEGSQFSLELKQIIQSSNSGIDNQSSKPNIGYFSCDAGTKARRIPGLEFLQDSHGEENGVQSTPSSEAQSMQFRRLEKISKYLMAQNICYSKCQHRLKGMLQQIVIRIQNKLSNVCKDFTYYSYHLEDSENNQVQRQAKNSSKPSLALDELEDKANQNLYEEMRGRYEGETEVENMCKFIRGTIEKLVESNAQFEKAKEKITELKVSNGILLKEQEKLLTYIEDRKSYSEKLKSKINDLKESIKRNAGHPDRQHERMTQELKQAHEAIQNLKEEVRSAERRSKEGAKMMEQLAVIEQHTDLKYRNRNDLILMIRALSSKVLKYEKEMNEDERLENKSNQVKDKEVEKDSEADGKRKRLLGQSIDKFLNKSANVRKKGSNPETNS